MKITLSPLSSIRLKLCLNYSIFCHDNMLDTPKAVAVATEALKQAVGGIDGLEDK